MKLTRRDFVKTTAVGAAGILAYKATLRSALAFANSGNLQKWIQPLRGLGGAGIPTLSSVIDPVFANTQFYQVTVGEFTDQLHPALPPTRLWGYWDTTNPVPRHLGGVILARRGTAARIRFTNTLPAQPIIPVDSTQFLPSDGGTANRTATHLHGGLVPWISDGGPFDWFDPVGVGGPSFLNGPGGIFDNILTQKMTSGQADYFYPNNQSARLVWYHDHAHGITRLNAYAGIASAYLILDAVNDAYVAAGKIPGLASTIPLIFQDKIFVSATTPVTDPTWAIVMKPSVQGIGSLWYAHIYDPKLYRLFNGQKTITPPDPSCVPEFFGDTMLTNGTVYPLITVEAKRYRFLMLNACNARVLNLNLLQVAAGADVITDPQTGFAAKGTPLGPKIIQIGNEAGFLLTETTHPNGLPVNPATFTGNLLLASAERADVIIDFTGLAGQEFMLYNDSPAPFPGGAPTNDYYLGNQHNPIQPLPGTGPDTRNVVRIKVVALTGPPDPQPAGPILNPLNLDPQPLVPYTTTVAPIPPLTPPAGVLVRDLTLNEVFDNYGRLIQLLGTTAPSAFGFGIPLDANPTEIVKAGATEVWRVFNTTADTHPIHFHLINLQVLSRQPFKMVSGLFTPTGAARGPEPEEVGWKETIKMNPGEVITLIAKFDLPAGLPFVTPPSPRTGGSEYVWHCHILEHEEHDMMRPLVVI